MDYKDLLKFVINLQHQSNCYQTLELDNMFVSQDQIKASYRKQSLKYHPDKNKGNEKWARQRFIEISCAYEVLSDKRKRKIYNQYLIATTINTTINNTAKTLQTKLVDLCHKIEQSKIPYKLGKKLSPIFLAFKQGYNS